MTEQVPHVQIVKILPTRIWIEDDLFGGRSVMLQHEGCDAFCYCTFHYDWRYTSNATTWQAADDMARALGANDPIERTHRGMPTIHWWHHVLAWVWRAWNEARAALSRARGEA